MKIPDFKDENEIAAFMEGHNGFELLDKGLAEIIETPVFRRKQACFIFPRKLLYTFWICF